MLIPNHPHDERLAELASRETDALADAALTAHVDSCVRCTELITELSVLRAALADLPEIAPSRPLRLLPPVEAEPPRAVDRLGGWARRFFAPVLASGAALALVGTIGTAAPALSPSAETGGAAPQERSTVQASEAEPARSTAPRGAAASTAPAASAGLGALAPAANQDSEDAATFGVGTVAAEESHASDEASTFDFEDTPTVSPDALTAERSPWPMVLFAGVALMIGALLLRWILVPRAG